ncbi:MAG: hypothetical protein ACTHME_05075 [Candidatus Nitrosocosmicus sp.]
MNITDTDRLNFLEDEKINIMHKSSLPKNKNVWHIYSNDLNGVQSSSLTIRDCIDRAIYSKMIVKGD